VRHTKLDRQLTNGYGLTHTQYLLHGRKYLVVGGGGLALGILERQRRIDRDMTKSTSKFKAAYTACFDRPSNTSSHVCQSLIFLRLFDCIWMCDAELSGQPTEVHGRMRRRMRKGVKNEEWRMESGGGEGNQRKMIGATDERTKQKERWNGRIEAERSSGWSQRGMQ